MSSASSSLLSDPSAAVDQAVAVGVEGTEHASSRATQEQPALHMVGQWRSTEVAGSGAARKRRRRMDRVEHDLSDEHWSALKAEWGVCAYCGATDQPLQRDCVLALSRGGGYTLDNIAGLRLLQRSTCNDEVTGWLRRKRFDERAFLVHHLEITTALALRTVTPPPRIRWALRCIDRAALVKS
jgi:hypothetical protein